MDYCSLSWQEIIIKMYSSFMEKYCLWPSFSIMKTAVLDTERFEYF